MSVGGKGKDKGKEPSGAGAGDDFELYAMLLVDAFPREVSVSERAFLEEVAWGSFGRFREVLATLGWPVHSEDGRALTHDMVSEEAKLLFRLRYPWASVEVPSRGASAFSFSSVLAAWLLVVTALCEDVLDALLEADGRLVWLYALDQVKEKFGTLRWYDRCDVDAGDAALVEAWSAASDRIDCAVELAEAVTGEICCSCGTSRDTWSTGSGWVHVICPSCHGALRDHGKDVDGILEEAGVRYWPWSGDVYAHARRYAMRNDGFFPVRSKVEGELAWRTFGPDGGGRVDIAAKAARLGVRHTLEMVRELDARLESDRGEVPDRDALVAELSVSGWA